MGAKEAGRCVREGVRLRFEGSFGLAQLPDALEHINRVSQFSTDLTLDFSACTAAFPGPIIGLNCEMDHCWPADLRVSLLLPMEEKLKRLFINANWAHHLAPESFPPGRGGFRGRFPATRFRNATEQSAVANALVDVLLASLGSLGRSDLAAIEWAIGEITDNVLTHSLSRGGGFLQASTLTNSTGIEFVVGDSGVSIPKTLASAYPGRSDEESLVLAIQEGVTRDTTIGQGNGLFGTFEVCRVSGGHLHIRSGHGNLYLDPTRGLHRTREAVPVNGTLIVGLINCARPDILKEALRFKGRVYTPTDRIELAYEDDDLNIVLFVAKEVESVFSRSSGRLMREKLANLVRLSRDSSFVRVDFSGLPVVSSSFADEVLAKLCAEIGEVQFRRKVRWVNTSDTVEDIIARAIAQRMGVGAPQKSSPRARQ